MTIAYDVTRLGLRLLSRTPNGIDRVDLGLGRRFLADTTETGLGIVGLRSTVIPSAIAREIMDAVSLLWGEELPPHEDAGYQAVLSRLTDSPQDRGLKRIRTLHLRQRLRIAKAYRHILTVSGSPKRHLPRDAIYFNASQFPLWDERYFGWLRERRDIKAAFFIHDLFPLEFPHFFPESEAERHRRRLANLARFGSAAVVASDYVGASLDDYMRRIGRASFPIKVMAMPCAEVFSKPPQRIAQLAPTPYFVCCSTIEPRKNHLLLMRVWEKLVQNHTGTIPKLILVGKRGWRYEPFTAFLEARPFVQQHVIEVSGLTSPALKSLLDNACGLLMPSFAEGYGLPVREGLQCGINVVASDIPAFREIKSKRLALLNLDDADAWFDAVVELSRNKPVDHISENVSDLLQSEDPFDSIKAFVQSL